MLSKMNSVTYYLFAIIFFFCVNHYDGFVQDGVVYTLQAINQMIPGRFIDDPAFMFGNQDSFSLFSPIYIQFIKLLPIDRAAFVLSSSIHLVYAVAVAWMVREWTNKFHCAQLALPIVLMFFCLYAYGEDRNDMWGSIKTIEATPVARTLSAGLGFAGLAALFKKNRYVSLFFFFLGTLMHPLTAGWGIPVWMLYHFPKIRLPLVVLSAFVPLTIFIDKVPFAKFPKEWTEMSFAVSGTPKIAFEMLACLLFFAIAIFKLELPKTFRHFLISLGIAVAIAYYWFLCSVLFGHIFLFQVQTFRIQWMCHIFILFVQITLCVKYFVRKFKDGKNLLFWEKILVASTFMFWIDSLLLIVFLASIIALLSMKNRVAMRTRGFTILICLSMGVFFFALGLFFYLKGISYPEFYVSYFVIIQELLKIIAAFVFTLAFLKPKSRILLLLFLVICCVISAETVSFFRMEVLAVGSLLIPFILIAMAEMDKLNGWLKRTCFAVLVVSLSAYAWTNYDRRTEIVIDQEMGMNQFVASMPFSYIEKRGRILYSVKEYGNSMPRIAFLSGAYYDEQYDVGNLFYFKHKQETDNREQNVYYGPNVRDSSWDALPLRYRKEKTLAKIFNKDSLITRFDYLCDVKEISHLVSDDSTLPYTRTDSLILNFKNLKIFLYPCP